MSGHNKWSGIKHKKGIADARRSARFTKHAKAITVAARRGSDPDMNAVLRLAIDKAKADNMPNDNIQRSIKRGAGEDKSAAAIEEVTYEGYGPGGVAIIVKCLTDNKNRTVSNTRHLFDSHGGSFGASVAWMFKQQGYIGVSLAGRNVDEVELLAIDAGVEDIEQDGDILDIYTNPKDFTKVRDKLKEAGLEIKESGIELNAKEKVKIEDEVTAKKILNLMEVLDDDEDVNEVASNFDIPDAILQKIT